MGDPKAVLITGPSSGIGPATARALARDGAHVLMVCRDAKRGDYARAAIAETATGPTPELFLADLFEQAQIHDVAGQIAHRHDCIDVLINNAGGVFGQRELTVDGIERTFAVNHLAPFLLTHLLLDLVLAAPAGRVVAVASEIHSAKLDFDNLQGERKYGFLDAYKRSKLANVLFSNELARRIGGTAATSNAVSPGPAKTAFGDNMTGRPALFPKVMKRLPMFTTPANAARGVVFLASDPSVDGVSGRFYLRTKETEPERIAQDSDVARQLWALSSDLCGITEPARA